MVSAAQLFDVQHYCSMTNHMWDGFWLVANKANWDTLPVAVQAVVARNMEDAGPRATRRSADTERQPARCAGGARPGVQPGPTLTPFRAALQAAGFYRDWEMRLGADAGGLLESTVGPLD